MYVIRWGAARRRVLEVELSIYLSFGLVVDRQSGPYAYDMAGLGGCTINTYQISICDIPIGIFSNYLVSAYVCSL